MSEKALKNAIYFLGVVTALYLLTTLLNRSDSASAAGGSDLAEALAVPEAEATEVLIEGQGNRIHLERAGDSWTVNGYPADSTAVSRFWRSVDAVSVASVAATNPANHDRLGVSADSAWSLTFDGGEPVLLGKSGSQFSTAYARLPSEDVVHLIRGDLRSAATRTLADWRDKLVLAVDTASVARVEVTREGSTRAFARQDSTWTADGDAADEAVMRNLLQELAAFHATGFAADSVEMKATPDRSVVVYDASGAELATLALDDGDGNLRAFSSQSPYIFEVPSWRADRVAPASEDDSGAS